MAGMGGASSMVAYVITGAGFRALAGRLLVACVCVCVRNSFFYDENLLTVSLSLSLSVSVLCLALSLFSLCV